jgi:hypothetical protein
MATWSRVDQSVRTHRKTLHVADALDLPVMPNVVGYLTGLWLWALDNADESGTLPVTAKVLERAVVWTGEAGAFVDALLNAGFLDRSDDGNLVIHDWPEYTGMLFEQRRANAERQRKSREQKRLGAESHSDITVTSHARHADVGGLRNERNERNERNDEEKSYKSADLYLDFWKNPSVNPLSSKEEKNEAPMKHPSSGAPFSEKEDQGGHLHDVAPLGVTSAPDSTIPMRERPDGTWINRGEFDAFVWLELERGGDWTQQTVIGNRFNNRIDDHIGCRVTANDVTESLKRLARRGYAERRKDATGGRPLVWWRARNPECQADARPDRTDKHDADIRA